MGLVTSGMIARTFGIVHAQHGHAVERQPLQEVEERLAQPAEVVAVGFHVVGVDVGDHRQHRLQIAGRRRPTRRPRRR